MTPTVIRATTLAVLRDHYYRAGSWHPSGTNTGRGWWSCACGARGEPVNRRLVDGHREHVADVMAQALTAGVPT
jgi:hypothetical protein